MDICENRPGLGTALVKESGLGQAAEWKGPRLPLPESQLPRGPAHGRIPLEKPD